MQSKSTCLPEYFTPELVAAVRHLSLCRDEHLFRTGQTVKGIYFVLEGELKAVRHLLKENEAIMMRAGAGEYFAESAIAGKKYSCDGVCVKTARLAFIPTAALMHAMGEPDFARALLQANAMNTRRQCSRYERVRLRKAKDRVLHLLACETPADGVFVWPASLSTLASELALEPETLYRALSELEKGGLISRNGKEFKIK